MSERDYEELKKLPRHDSLMEWDKSDLAAHSIKYQSLCGKLIVELEALKTREAALLSLLDAVVPYLDNKGYVLYSGQIKAALAKQL